MRVEVNGRPLELPSPLSVAALLGRLGLDSEPVAVERNGRLVPREAWDSTPLESGDRVEIVTLVGGG